MRVKDYYRILELPPVASQQEIRRSYRRLAHRYHPDKNIGDLAAEAHFKELAEAYSVLSDPMQRENYNYQRWHQRTSGKKYNSPSFSPQSILQESVSIRNYVAGVDIFRMNHEALAYQLREVLSEHNIQILQQFNETVINRQIIGELITAARLLQHAFIAPIAEKIMQVAGNDIEAVAVIQQFLQQHARNNKWQVYRIILIVGVTILLCLLIYWMGK